MKNINNSPIQRRSKSEIPANLSSSLADMMLNKFGVSAEAFPLQIPEMDDTGRIQRAINSITSGFVVLANKTYNITSLTMKTGVFLYSLNATLKLINNAPNYANMVYFQGVSNTGILGTITIDGNRINNGLARETGQIGIKISYGCSDLYFGTLFIKNTTEDGFYVGGTTTPQPQNINVQKMIVDNAGRNGISITSGQDMFFGDVVTRNTTGVAPQAGVDIETNVAGDLLTNINFDSLTTYGNVGCGFQIVGYDLTNLSQGHVSMKKLISRNNQSHGALITGVSHIQILDGIINNNTFAGVSIPRNVRHLRLKSDVFLNGTRGIDLVMATQNIQSYDFDFSGCNIYNNSQTTANTSDGIRADSDSSSYIVSRVYVDKCVLYDDQATPTQRYGLSTGANTEKVTGKIDPYGNATSTFLILGTKSRVTTIEQNASLSTTSQTVSANSTLNLDVTFTGAIAGGKITVTPQTTFPSGLVWNVFIPSSNTVRIVISNPTATPVSLPALSWYADFFI